MIASFQLTLSIKGLNFLVSVIVFRHSVMCALVAVFTYTLVIHYAAIKKNITQY